MKQIDTTKQREYPIVRFWYTKYKGLTIEEIIDKDLDFFLWIVSSFQDVTSKQAAYFEKKTGKVLNALVIKDVDPYEYVKGDPEKMYIELCECNDLDYIIRKYRGVQPSLF